MEALFGQVARTVFAHASRLIEGEMTFARLMAMFHLYRQGPQTIAELAHGALLSHAATSRMVDGLVRLGIVDRSPGDTDRRQRRVALTAAGVERLESLRAVTADAYGQLLADLPAGARDQLDQVLDALLPRVDSVAPPAPRAVARRMAVSEAPAPATPAPRRRVSARTSR